MSNFIDIHPKYLQSIKYVDAINPLSINVEFLSFFLHISKVCRCNQPIINKCRISFIFSTYQ